MTVFLGLLLGVLVSLTSIDVGAIGIVVLRYLYPRLPAARLVGSDIAHAVPLTLIAGSGHWLIGDVNWTPPRLAADWVHPRHHSRELLHSTSAGTCFKADLGRGSPRRRGPYGGILTKPRYRRSMRWLIQAQARPTGLLTFRSGLSIIHLG